MKVADFCSGLKGSRGGASLEERRRAKASQRWRDERIAACQTGWQFRRCRGNVSGAKEEAQWTCCVVKLQNLISPGSEALFFLPFCKTATTSCNLFIAATCVQLSACCSLLAHGPRFEMALLIDDSYSALVRTVATLLQSKEKKQKTFHAVPQMATG